MARYEDDDRGRPHYVTAGALVAVCGEQTTGIGTYTDETGVPSTLCGECLKILEGLLA